MPSRLERLEPESPSLLLPVLVDSFLDLFHASVVSGRWVIVVAVDVEVRCIRSNVVAKLIVREFWASGVSGWFEKERKRNVVPHGVPGGQCHCGN